MDAPSRPATRQRSLPGGGDKLRRALWQVAWLLLYRPSPTVLHGWRRWLLRLHGARIGPRCHPYPSARVWAPWNLEMNAGSCIGAGVECYNVDKVVLGADSLVSQRAFLCAAGHDIRREDFALVTGPIAIAAGAWVGAEAFVGPGVSIGERAVVGARAVVTRDVPASTVVAGNPARIVGTRDRGTAADAAASVMPGNLGEGH